MSNVCHGFGTRVPPASLSHMILLGVTKYVSDRASLTSIALDLKAKLHVDGKSDRIHSEHPCSQASIGRLMVLSELHVAI